MGLWMKLGIIIGVPVLIAGFILTYQGSPKEITEIADQFKPGRNWQLTDERIVAPAITCLEANCPSVYRSWEIGKGLTKIELQLLLDESGWGIKLKDDCLPSENVTGVTPLCSAQGKAQEYDVSVTLWGSRDSNTKNRIVLYVEK